MRLSTLLWGTLSISTVLAVIVTRPAKAETKIGVLAGFSGVSAGYGTAYRTGIELAPRKDGYSFIFEDDQFLPAKTISAFNKLVTIDKISSAFIGDTVTAQAVAPIARRNKIPLYVWASSSFEANEGSLTTRLWTTDEEDFDYATKDIKKRGIARVALFTSTHTYADSWGRYIAAQLRGSVQQRFDLDQSNFQAAILRTSQQKFDAIGVCLNSGQIGLFARQLRQLKSTIPLFACHFVESDADIDAASGALDGVFFTAPKVSTEFREQYIKARGNTNHLFSAAVFHTAALLATDQIKHQSAFIGMRRITTPKGSSYLSFPFTRYRFHGSEIREEP
jgi:ABC-type branched-subunit amino acid transport system substrate-binding protein